MAAQTPKGILLTILGLTASLLGCSPGLWLHNPGRVVLAQQGRTVEIKPKQLVSIKWLADGVVYSTQARVGGEDTPVGVQIAAADEQYLRLRSKDWHSLEDLPRNYLKLKEVKITASKGGHQPIVAIPIHQVKEIGIYEGIKPPVLSRFSKKDVFIGALGGVSIVMGSVVSNSILPEQDQGSEVLAATVVGAAAGAIVYPAYKVLNPRREQELTTYPVDDQEGWKIEISRE